MSEILRKVVTIDGVEWEEAYKCTNEDMTCKGFQYEMNTVYEMPENEVRCCHLGFHACLRPADCLRYYGLNAWKTRFFKVLQAGKFSYSGDDTKRASSKIMFVEELTYQQMLDATIKWNEEHTDESASEHSNEKHGVSSTTGCKVASSTTGDYGISSATGDYGSSSATGYKSASSATGNYAVSFAVNDCSASCATGNCSASCAAGKCSASSATGNAGTSSATGYRGASSATCYKGTSSATGNCGVSSATGYKGVSSATGNCGVAVSTSTGGKCTVAKDSVAVSAGFMGRVMAKDLGAVLVVIERGPWDGTTYPIISYATAIVDGEKVKPNVWYTCKDSQFVECEEDVDDEELDGVELDWHDYWYREYYER